MSDLVNELREGQSCRTCRYFSDHTEPDDPLGYCTWSFCMGEPSCGKPDCYEDHEYGGHWTHIDGWCPHWDGGEKIWTREVTRE